MPLNNRIRHNLGQEVGVSGMYGTMAFGTVGMGIGSTPGEMGLETVELNEINLGIPALVGGLYGSYVYGKLRVRQAEAPTEVAAFRFRQEGAFAPLFIEEDLESAIIGLRVDTDYEAHSPNFWETL